MLRRVCTYVLRQGELLQCTKIGCGNGCLRECYLTSKFSITFYFLLKDIEKKVQKKLFSIKNNNYCTGKQTKLNNCSKKLQLNTITVHHKWRHSIHCSGLTQITQIFNCSNCFVQSSIREVIFLKECKVDAKSLPLTVHRLQ